jgi:hypothetical protein
LLELKVEVKKGMVLLEYVAQFLRKGHYGCMNTVGALGFASG